MLRPFTLCRLARPHMALPALRRDLATLGIRAEAPSRIWERRSPLTPEAVGELVREGVKVMVESSEKRIFPDRAFEKVGAAIVESADEAELILGVKEIPIDRLQHKPTSTYAAFHHVHKGQSYNTPYLQQMISTPARFIDWELLKCGQTGLRTTGFGHLAGFSGMADGLSTLGTKALARGGWVTPLLRLPRPYQTEGVEELKGRLKWVGEQVREFGWPEGMGPVTVVITGTGKVGQGAREVLETMGAEWISPAELRKVAEDPKADRHKVYGCHLELGDYLVHKTGKPFDRELYRRHPEQFTSNFHTDIAPYATMFLNGGFWQEGCPRLLTTSQLAEVQATAPENRFLSIVDVACDFGGGLEFVTEATTLDDPVVQVSAEGQTVKVHREAGEKLATQLSSIEILPTALPLDASRQFSDSILPYIRSLIKDPKSHGKDELASALRAATVVQAGELVGSHKKLECSLRANPGPAPQSRKVLLLGSGLVAGPAVRVLTERADVSLTIASNDLPAAQALARASRSRAVELSASDTGHLAELIAQHEVVLSLLPAPLHVGIAELCIAHGASLVTASYVSPAMSALHSRAKEAGVVLLNELGLDPGIDHASAMRLIDEATQAGNTVKSFVSFCGGLPSPEQSNGPLGYKFSWSPRGVLTAALNDARYRINGAEVKIAGKDLLARSFKDVPIIKGFAFEGVANRDSVPYLKEYGLDAGLETILRGTLRYKGFSETVDVFKRIGLLGLAKLTEKVERWEDLTDVCLRASGFQVKDEAQRKAIVLQLAGGDERTAQLVLETLAELHLVPSANRTAETLPPLPSTAEAPLDLLSTLLGSQLSYAAHEPDAVILHHELGTVTPSGAPELFTSTLVQYGQPGGASAMATTVGAPIAIGALLILDGHLRGREGLVSPASEEVWKPLLDKLEGDGMRFDERRRVGARGVLATLEKGIEG